MADLRALTVGVALAASLDWTSSWPQVWTIGGGPAPRWYMAVSYLVESFWKGSAALLPVILARRARYGGPIRPAEFLALAVGFPRHLQWFERLPAFGLVFPNPDTLQGGYRINPEVFDSWVRVQLAVGLMSASLFVIRRRRPPTWAAGVLLVIAWHGLTRTGLPLVRQGFDRWLIATQGPFWTRLLVYDGVSSWPIYVVGYLPWAAAILDLGRRGRRAWTWVEGAALGMPVCWWIVTQPHTVARVSLENRGNPACPWKVGQAGLEPVVALALALAIVHRLGPAWRRWAGTA